MDNGNPRSPSIVYSAPLGAKRIGYASIVACLLISGCSGKKDATDEQERTAENQAAACHVGGELFGAAMEKLFHAAEAGAAGILVEVGCKTLLAQMTANHSTPFTFNVTPVGAPERPVVLSLDALRQKLITPPPDTSAANFQKDWDCYLRFQEASLLFEMCTEGLI